MLGKHRKENFRGDLCPSGTEETSPLEASLARQAELETLVSLQQRQLGEMRDLLDEVNHRAKNSLQMAMAMLSMQALASEQPVVVDALNAASQRLSYLARVHELLYQRGDRLQTIDVAEFLEDIAGALANAFRRPEVQVLVTADSLMLPASHAINLALIAGEALLNAQKYAYPDDRAGKIEVRLRVADGSATLSVTDDGVGFSVAERRGSLGMRLLRALGRAVGGETLVSGESGTSVSVTFPVPHRI